MNWLIEIQGPSPILYNICTFIRSPHFYIFDDSDDHQCEQYHLRSSHFNGNGSVYEVVSAAHVLIRLTMVLWQLNMGSMITYVEVVSK